MTWSYRLSVYFYLKLLKTVTDQADFTIIVSLAIFAGLFTNVANKIPDTFNNNMICVMEFALEALCRS